jgi:hypothetical protein
MRIIRNFFVLFFDCSSEMVRYYTMSSAQLISTTSPGRAWKISARISLVSQETIWPKALTAGSQSLYYSTAYRVMISISHGAF